MCHAELDSASYLSLKIVGQARNDSEYKIVENIICK